MTGDLRIIETEAGPVVPVMDIARQMGCSRTTISNIMRRHPSLFRTTTSSEWLETPSGKQKHTCIAKSAVEDLISHLRPLNHDDLPARIDTFRASQIRKNAILPALSDVLTEYGKRARALAEDWDVDIAVARKVLMAAAVEKYPDLTPCRALIPANSIPLELPEKTGSNSSEPELPKADPDYDRYFGIRDVAKFCQCQENQARKILVDEGVLAYQNDHVILTRYGERFGKVFTHYPEFPHRMVPHTLIRYSPEAVQLVRGKLFGIQTHLPQKTTTGARI